MNKRISAASLLVALVFTVTALISPVLYAQSNGTVNQDGVTAEGYGDSLKISPLRTDITLRPGESRKVTIYIQNLNPVAMSLKPINNDFIAGNREDGTPDIILNENESSPTHSLKRFMEQLPDVTVAPGERKAVDVTINVPHNADAGGYYGALRFAPTLSDGSGSVTVSGSITSLIALTVPGNIKESLSVKEFGIQQNGKTSTRFGSSKDIEMMIRLENKGNVHVAPRGEVFVQKGDKIIYQTKINDTKPPGLVLPSSIRKWSVPLKDLGSFGKYKVTAVVSYGSSNETITVEQNIWIIPAIFIIGAIVALVVLILLIVMAVMSLRAYKRRILRGARRR